MSVRVHCDGPNCDKSFTDDHHRPLGWLKVERLDDARLLGDNVPDPRHYCSVKCEYDHAYVLAHADAGK